MAQIDSDRDLIQTIESTKVYKPNSFCEWCKALGYKQKTINCDECPINGRSREMSECKCENCTEWEYFEGYGYGCFCMKTMTPIDAEKCEFYADKRPDVPHSWKPSESKEGAEE